MVRSQSLPLPSTIISRKGVGSVTISSHVLTQLIPFPDPPGLVCRVPRTTILDHSAKWSTGPRN